MARKRDGPPPRSHARRPGTGTRADSDTTISRNRRRVYVAAPVLSYGTKLYDEALRTIRRLFPNAELIEARNAFRNTEDWKRRWPEMLATIDRIVFIASPERLLGGGVLAEIVEARLRNVPVDYLDERGELHPAQDLALELLAIGDPFRIARVAVRSSRRTR
jgi:hypothetical protein